MLRPRRALALLGAAGVAALAVSGCSNSSSSSSDSTVTVTGNTLAIVVSAPAGYQHNAVYKDIVDAETLAYDLHKREVKKFHLVEVPLSHAEVSQTARETIITNDPIAYIGEIQPGVSDQTVGITNDIGLLQVSPTDTALELGQSTPAVVDAPKTYFQQWSSYGRTFARVVPTSAQEAAAQVAEMQDLKISSLYVGDDLSAYGAAFADALRDDARKAGIALTHDETGAGAIFYATTSPAAAVRFFDRAASANPNAKLFGTSALDTPAFTAKVSSAAAKRLYVTTPGFMPKQLPTQASVFDAEFKTAYHHEPTGEAIFGFAAMTAVIEDLAKLGAKADNRTDVVKGFLHSKYTDSVLGDYSIGGDGNTSLDAFVWNKISGGKLVPFKAAS